MSPATDLRTGSDFPKRLDGRLGPAAVGETHPGPPLKLLWPERWAPVELPSAEVHLWAWPLECGQEDEVALNALLDEEERERAGRFLFQRHRAAYVTARARMRCVLGAYLDRSPVALGLGRDALGKPQVSSPQRGAPIQFNLGHSERLALLAVSRNIALGVDVEELVPLQPEAAWETAKAHFSPRELGDLAWLRRAAPEESEDGWIAGFYRCWTRKEAIAKGEGAGLRIPLDAFDVTLLPEAPARLLGSRPAANLRRDWELYDLTPAAEMVGALAASPKPERIACFSLAT